MQGRFVFLIKCKQPCKPGSVFQTAIYLGPLLPTASCDTFETGRAAPWFHFVLLRVGFTGTHDVTATAVGSYPTFPSLPAIRQAVYFCCTILRVASTGR